MVTKCGKLSYNQVSNFLVQVYLSQEEAGGANKLQNMYKPVLVSPKRILDCVDFELTK